MTLEYKGVFPAPPTPVTEDGRIHEKALRALLEDNIAHGAGGFWMAGTTGEGPILTDEQRDAVARISGETCKGRALVIMHVGAISTASAVKAARTARSAGCDAVCCLPPFFFPSSRAFPHRALQGGGRRRGRPSVLRLQPAAAHAGRDGAGADGEVHAGDSDAQGLEAFGAQLRRYPRLCRHGSHLLLRQWRFPASRAHHGGGRDDRRAAVACHLGTTPSCTTHGRPAIWPERKSCKRACASTWISCGCSTPWRTCASSFSPGGWASTAGVRSLR